jgi:hypothetical protein
MISKTVIVTTSCKPKNINMSFSLRPFSATERMMNNTTMEVAVVVPALREFSNSTLSMSEGNYLGKLKTTELSSSSISNSPDFVRNKLLSKMLSLKSSLKTS